MEGESSMFYCSSSVGSDPLSVSKSDISRGIITEKSSTAAREISAVVERTVADYEQEASGFRQEIDRQRRQSESSQPQVRSHRRRAEAGLPDSQSHEVVVVGEEEEQRGQQRNTGVGDVGSPDFVWYNDDDDDYHDEEKQALVPSTSKQEDSKDPDYEIPARFQPVKRRPKKPQISCYQNHSVFKVRLSEDPQTEVVSNVVLQKNPIHDLTCPRDLQESEFSSHSRSTFPQSAAGEPFDLFITDNRRRSRPSVVNTSTPEEIYRSMKSSRHAVFYIRSKTEEGKDSEKEEQDLQLVQDEPKSTDCLPLEDETAPIQSPEDLYHSRGSVDAGEEAAESDTGSVDGNEAFSDDEWKPNPKEHEDSEDPENPKPKRTVKEEPRQVVEKGEESKVHCQVCGVFCKTMFGLTRHAWNHMDDPKSICGVCGESFSSQEDLKGHFKVHKKTYDCPHCEKSFFTTKNLKNHVTQHNREGKLECDFCNKTFANIPNSKAHHWVHVKRRPHKCNMCPKSFGLERQLVAHKKRHVNLERLICNICGRSLSSSKSSISHKFTHSDERHFACKVCGKRFKQDSSSLAHEKVHTVRERKYSCHICSKGFMYNRVSMCHLKSHSGERAFVCSVCTKGFIVKSSLTRHMRIHTGEAPYGCSQCGRHFRCKGNSASHMRVHLGTGQVTCGVCGKTLSRKEHLPVHMRIHNGERPYKCSLCEKAFIQNNCSKFHMKHHHPEEFVLQEPSTSDVTPPETEGSSKGL